MTLAGFQSTNKTSFLLCWEEEGAFWSYREMGGSCLLLKTASISSKSHFINLQTITLFIACVNLQTFHSPYRLSAVEMLPEENCCVVFSLKSGAAIFAGC